MNFTYFQEAKKAVGEYRKKKGRTGGGPPPPEPDNTLARIADQISDQLERIPGVPDSDSTGALLWLCFYCLDYGYGGRGEGCRACVMEVLALWRLPPFPSRSYDSNASRILVGSEVVAVEEGREGGVK